MVRRSSLLPLNENADVRAATLKLLSGVRAVRISSAMPVAEPVRSFAALRSVCYLYGVIRQALDG